MAVPQFQLERSQSRRQQFRHLFPTCPTGRGEGVPMESAMPLLPKDARSQHAG